MISQLVMIPLTRYQAVAAIRASKGLRPNMLPCEVTFGEYCSARFARFMKTSGVKDAIADLRARCPKGSPHANNALLYSTVTALAPLLTTRHGTPGDCIDCSNDDCFASPC